MINSEFSNFFETFYLQEVKQSEQSEVRYVTIRTHGIEARMQNLNTLDTLALNGYP